MTWTSSMSSGYSSLEEEDSEEYFFTARTSFFRRPPGKTRAAPQVSAERRLGARPGPPRARRSRKGPLDPTGPAVPSALPHQLRGPAGGGLQPLKSLLKG